MFTVCRRTVKANNYLSFQPRGKCETWRSGKFAVKSLPKSTENASSTFGASVGVTFKLNLPPKGQGVREICIPLHGVRQWEIPSPLVQPRGWPKVLRSIELTAVPFYHLLFFFEAMLHGSQIFHPLNLCVPRRERSHAARWRNMADAQFMRLSKQSVVQVNTGAGMEQSLVHWVPWKGNECQFSSTFQRAFDER